jgi:hypothetical protein
MAYQLLAWAFKYVQIRIAATDMATSSEEFGEQRLRLISGVKGSDGISGEGKPRIVA